MSVIDAFLSTWSTARGTFGQGTPHTGEQYDRSATLRDMQADVRSAAAGSRWTGAAAAAYDTANDGHREVFGKLAGLDRRLGAHVDESAQVVSAGRRDLDALRTWVLDAAASVPPGRHREQMLMSIVQKGLGQLGEIVTTSNAELSTIGGHVRTISAEYQALGNQKFGCAASMPGGSRT